MLQLFGKFRICTGCGSPNCLENRTGRERKDMFKDEFKAVCNSAAAKLNLMKSNPLGYFVASILAGVFVAMGGFVAFTLAGHLSSSEATAIWAKPAQSAAFAAALSLVVMAGADLFTGNNFVMASAGFRKTAAWGDIFKLWGFCWIGNLVGSLLSSALFVAAKVPTGAIGDYFVNLAANKTTTAPVPLFMKAVLCNILVCLAVWCGIKMKSESGKLIMIFWCIFVFMICGFEHSIANMSSIGVSLLTGKVGIGPYLYNVVIVTLGNMVGGIVGVALPYHIISKDK